MNYCDKVSTCTDVCNCILVESPDGSIIVSKDVSSSCSGGSCKFLISINPDEAGGNLEFNPVTRELCLVRGNGNKSCVTLPNDLQQISLNGNNLCLSKGGGCVDLSAYILANETPFNATSNSIIITPGGTKGHNPHLEIKLSEDGCNPLLLGSDGGLFLSIPTLIQCLQDIGCTICGPVQVCQSPTNVVFNSNSKVLSWTSNQDSFILTIKPVGGSPVVVPITPTQTSVNQWSVNLGAYSFVNNSVYSFCVQAVCDDGSISECIENCFIAQYTGTVTASNVTATSAQISWTALNGISSYGITINGGPMIYVGNVTQFTVTTLAAGSNNTIQVKYITPDGCIGNVNGSVNVTTLGCQIPTNVSFDKNTKILSWNSSQSSFQLTISNGSTSNIVPITPTSVGPNMWQANLSSYSFANNTVYTFCLKADCNSSMSSCNIACSLVNYTGSIITSGITATSVTLNWTPVANVDEYLVSVNGGADVSAGNAPPFTVTGLNPGANNTIQLKFRTVDGCIGNIGNALTVTTLGCPTPTNVSFNSTTKVLSWSSIPNQSSSNFEIWYVTETSWVLLSSLLIQENPGGSGNYTVNLTSSGLNWGIPFGFCVKLKCGSTTSDCGDSNCPAPTNVMWDAINRILTWVSDEEHFNITFTPPIVGTIPTPTRVQPGSNQWIVNLSSLLTIEQAMQYDISEICVRAICANGGLSKCGTPPFDVCETCQTPTTLSATYHLDGLPEGYTYPEYVRVRFAWQNIVSGTNFTFRLLDSEIAQPYSPIMLYNIWGQTGVLYNDFIIKTEHAYQLSVRRNCPAFWGAPSTPIPDNQCASEWATLNIEYEIPTDPCDTCVDVENETVLYDNTDLPADSFRADIDWDPVTSILTPVRYRLEYKKPSDPTFITLESSTSVTKYEDLMFTGISEDIDVQYRITTMCGECLFGENSFNTPIVSPALTSNTSYVLTRNSNGTFTVAYDSTALATYNAVKAALLSDDFHVEWEFNNEAVAATSNITFNDISRTITVNLQETNPRNGTGFVYDCDGEVVGTTVPLQTGAISSIRVTQTIILYRIDPSCSSVKTFTKRLCPSCSLSEFTSSIPSALGTTEDGVYKVTLRWLPSTTGSTLTFEYREKPIIDNVVQNTETAWQILTTNSEITTSGTNSSGVLITPTTYLDVLHSGITEPRYFEYRAIRRCGDSCEIARETDAIIFPCSSDPDFVWLQGFINSDNPVIQWSEECIPGTTSDNWKLATSPDGSVYTFVEVPTTSFTPEDPIPGRCYWEIDLTDYFAEDCTGACFAPDTTYHFCLFRKCEYEFTDDEGNERTGDVFGNHVPLCIYDGIIPNVSKPLVEQVNNHSVDVTWTHISGYNHMWISVDNNTPIYIGNVTTHQFTGLDEGEHTVQLYFSKSNSNVGCTMIEEEFEIVSVGEICPIVDNLTVTTA